MLRGFSKIIILGVLVLSGVAGIYRYRDFFSESERKYRQVEQEKKELQQIVQRFSDEKRAADVIVTEQKSVNDVLHTTLLFVEYARDGSTLPPKEFSFEGNQAHIDAMVIKFQQAFIKDDDQLRGHSIVLFTRIFGDKQTPEQAQVIDEPGKVPEIYRGADPRVSTFELELWKDFWKLESDPKYRAEKGVRVANPESLWGPWEVGKIYRITLEATGGLNRSSEPIPDIYREAIKKRDVR
ncbi:MAG TPA: hypothetical protein VIL86_06495 [Tepidisphaeraceae bacterium]|jgi:hypothetical protein